MVKEIELQNNLRAIVDDEDYERVMQHRWYYQKQKTTIVVTTKDFGGRTLGNFILDCKNDESAYLKNPEDQLNYTRANLVSSNKIISSAIRRGIGGSSKYKGVTWDKSINRWRARLEHNGKRIYAGLFIDEDEAAKAYNSKVKELKGELAYINVIGVDNNAKPIKLERCTTRRRKGVNSCEAK